MQWWRVHFQEMGTVKAKISIDLMRILFSRNTILTIDRRVNVINETECLHQLGLSKELRGGAKSEYEIEQARALLPEAFKDFATRKTFLLQSHPTMNHIL